MVIVGGWPFVRFSPPVRYLRHVLCWHTRLNHNRGAARMSTDTGWDKSAQAWIEVMGEDGDWGRRYVLDAPMLAYARSLQATRAADIGCGEGRFCRMLQTLGVRTIGIDPTEALIMQALRLDAHGDYRVGKAEALDLPDAHVDLVVSYLTLIDIDDLEVAIAESYRILRPGGTLLIANVQSFNTAADPVGWTHEPDGSRRFCIDGYLEERANWIAWRGIRIRNWHRPLSRYMRALLDAGFVLRHFDEPAPQGVDDDKAQRYRRAPNFLVMAWRKPG
jgi:SAM-dependent methyltransferase